MTPKETARHNRALALIAQVETPGTELAPAVEILEGEVIDPDDPRMRMFFPEHAEFERMGFSRIPSMNAPAQPRCAQSPNWETES